MAGPCKMYANCNRCSLSNRSRLCGTFLVLILIGLTRLSVSVSGKPSCPPGHFRNMSSVPGRCIPCSTCPINHIVRRPCNRQNDTVCGPFYEFEFFNQRHEQMTGKQFVTDRHVRPDTGHAVADQSDDDSRPGQSVSRSASCNSPDEAGTVRCSQSQWRVLSYGLVAALVIAVSIALSTFAMFSYCRANVKTLRLPETTGASGPAIDDDDLTASSGTASTTTIIVNRDVRHLEEQLIHNQRRKAFLRWLFGSASAADRLFSSNDYLDERHRRHFLRMLEASSGVTGSSAESLALQPYPGMISIDQTDNGHGSRDHHRLDLDNDETRVDEDLEGQGHCQGHPERRLSRRLDCTQQGLEKEEDEEGEEDEDDDDEEQSQTKIRGETSLLIPEMESSRQSADD